ncbi:MAG: dTDP-4-amino-4,6-dideoxygalactose transaminase [Solirubrobacteraceae bacterium]
MTAPDIPFNRPYATGNEFKYIQQALDNLHLSGNGPFSARCAKWLEAHTGAARALLTPSCTAALEMAMLLADIGPGDEVVLPSFTFVSTASAVALRGATPVFADIRPDTLNLDPEQVAAAVTPATKAIVPVHYAGVGADMPALTELAADHGLGVIEDAAQGVLSAHGDRALGAWGRLGCLSFHETKNVSCGEGGALLVNDPDLIERAEILHEKGTNRSQFFRGQTDRYTWVDLGSSFVASDLSAAFLWAQLERAEEITERRLAVWRAYHEALEPLEREGRLRRPVVPDDRRHNAHMYYVLARDEAARDRLIEDLGRQGIQAVFHYVPLHSSPAGRRLGRAHGALAVTDDVAGRLARLPMWIGMEPADVERVADAVGTALA